jgi:hypothetical protein
MRLMGYSSVTVSQRYVHPAPEALERTVEHLQPELRTEEFGRKTCHSFRYIGRSDFP